MTTEPPPEDKTEVPPPAPPAVESAPTPPASAPVSCAALIAVPDNIDSLTEACRLASKEVALIAEKGGKDPKAPGDVSIIALVGGLTAAGVSGGMFAIAATPVVVTALVGGAGIAVATAGGIRVARFLAGIYRRDRKNAAIRPALEEAQTKLLAAMQAMWTEQDRVATAREALVKPRAERLKSAAAGKIGQLVPIGDIPQDLRASFADPDRPGEEIHLQVTKVEVLGEYDEIRRDITFRLYEAPAGEGAAPRELDFMSPMTISRPIKFEVERHRLLNGPPAVFLRDPPPSI